MSAFQQLLDGNRGLVIHNPDEMVENDLITGVGTRFDSQRIQPVTPSQKQGNDRPASPNWNEGRIQAIEDRVQAIDGRVQNIEGKLQKIEGNLGELNQFAKTTNDGLQKLNQKVDEGFQKFDQKIQQLLDRK